MLARGGRGECEVILMLRTTYYTLQRQRQRDPPTFEFEPYSRYDIVSFSSSLLDERSDAT
jgi:hypothetical protein